MKKENNTFVILQRLGKSFMFPIATLPIAGLLLGIGSSFTNYDNLLRLGLVDVIKPGSFIYGLFSVFCGVGSAIFDNLPLIFAIGVAIGLANKEKEISALSAALAYITMNITINKILLISGMIDSNGNVLDGYIDGAICNTLGITTLQIGVFGGIVIGIIVSILHNKYRTIVLPDYLAFFGGNRFIPIISVCASIVLGIVFFYLWPFVQSGIVKLGLFVSKGGALGAFLFDFIKRLLIPFGLHHVFYLPFWQTALGGTAQIADITYTGAQNILFAQLADPNTIHISKEAAMFFSGCFPIMIFGLPAACIAIYKNAKENKKKIVKSLMISAAVASVVTGITEPIEFPILFASPLLYLIHSILTGLSNMILYLLNVTIGCTFSDGLIDLVLFGILPGNPKTSWILLIPIGIVFFFIYYFIFDYTIKRFNLKTPGREDDDIEIKIDAINQDASTLIVSGLGGRENIDNIECCATRLRVAVNDETKIKEDDIKSTGALGIIKDGCAIQIIYGPKVNIVKAKLDDYLNGVTNTNSLKIYSPFIGKLVKLEDVPDDAFKTKTMGDGVAVEIENEFVYAPACGKIEFIFPTKHAIGFRCIDGTGILIHVGIDTVKLNGKGFKVLCKEGEDVKQGAALLKIDLDYLKQNAPSMISPIIITELKGDKKIEIESLEYVNNTDVIIQIFDK